MATLPTAIPTKFSIPFLITLIGAGLADNYFKFPIFLNIDFLFGSIFAMLALQFFVVGCGIAAAACPPTYIIMTNQPVNGIVNALVARLIISAGGV